VLSLQRCRFLLGADCNLTDAELEQLRQELYAWSEVAISAFCAQKPLLGSCRERGDSPMLKAIPDGERPGVEERAAILEFEAGLRKPEAERQAFGEWTASKKVRFVASKPRPNKKRPALSVVL
jgi:hypothetical protein